MNFGNLYTRLRLTAAATQAEIKTAYYRLSKIYHPDTNTNSSKAGPQFRGITEAYKVLGNPKTRAEYDKELSQLKRSRFSVQFQRGPFQPEGIKTQSNSLFDETDESFETRNKNYRERNK